MIFFLVVILLKRTAIIDFKKKLLSNNIIIVTCFFVATIVPTTIPDYYSRLLSRLLLPTTITDYLLSCVIHAKGKMKALSNQVPNTPSTKTTTTFSAATDPLYAAEKCGASEKLKVVLTSYRKTFVPIAPISSSEKVSSGPQATPSAYNVPEKLRVLLATCKKTNPNQIESAIATFMKKVQQKYGFLPQYDLNPIYNRKGFTGRYTVCINDLRVYYLIKGLDEKGREIKESTTNAYLAEKCHLP